MALAALVGSLPLSLVVAASAPARNVEPPSFPSRVELVTVDAVVLDKSGNPVTGLSRDDFVVLEDGVPQPIVSFEAFSAATPMGMADSGLARKPELGRKPPQGRPFALIVDDLQIRPTLVPATRRAIAEFLQDSLREGDQVTLVTTSGSGWRGRLPEARPGLLAALGRIAGRDFGNREPGAGGVGASMGEYQAFEMIRKGGGGAPAGLAPGGGDARDAWALAQSIDVRRRAHLDRILDVLQQVLQAWDDLRGRKSILFLSEGFLQDGSSQQRTMAAVTREANAAVYFVDVRGLVPPRQFGPDEVGLIACPSGNCAQPIAEPAPLVERVADAGGAVDLADLTGGFSVRNTNDLAGGLARAAAEARVFYLLGFRPPEGKRDTAWRKLRVQVNRRGLRVRSRAGYRLRTAAERPGAR